MSILFLGDIHGNFKKLQDVHNRIIDNIENSDIKAIIQVGDFGFYPKELQNIYQLDLKIPVYAIDGNHEWFPMLIPLTDVTEITKNLFYVPRGTVLEIDGRTIAFCGGAASVDKKYRLAQGMDWFDDENITDEQFARLDGLEKCDILVTHCAPQSVVQHNLNPTNLLMFGLPVTWTDSNSDKIEALWARLNYPINICGHYHMSISDKTCRILDINETIVL